MADAAYPDVDYDLSALGWLLFERLCAGWLEELVGVAPDYRAQSSTRLPPTREQGGRGRHEGTAKADEWLVSRVLADLEE